LTVCLASSSISSRQWLSLGSSHWFHTLRAAPEHELTSSSSVCLASSSIHGGGGSLLLLLLLSR
jgi:hypothetical protein